MPENIFGRVLAKISPEFKKVYVSPASHKSKGVKRTLYRSSSVEIAFQRPVFDNIVGGDFSCSFGVFFVEKKCLKKVFEL